MTQKYADRFTPGTFDSDGDEPSTWTLPSTESSQNARRDRSENIRYDGIVTTSADPIIEFEAPDDGNILGVTLVNGTVGVDGSNGLELNFINKSNSDEKVGYFGFGSGTEAAKADDTDAAVAAQEVATIRNATSGTVAISKGDKISCTGDRDGTTIVGQIIVHFEGADVPRS